MAKLDVVGLGALNMDHLYQVERILEDGEAVVSTATLSPGGSAANTIYALAKLGVRTGFLGAIGDDAEGKTLLDDFQVVGVDASQVRVKPGAKTGAVVCLSDSLGRRSLYVLPGANSLLSPSDLKPNYIKQAKMLHLSSFAGDEQFKLSLELVEGLGSSTRVSFAPGAIYVAKGLPALAPILTRAHVLFANHHEIQQLTRHDIASGAETCLRYGCHIVAVTFGKGIIWKNVMASGYVRDADTEHVIEQTGQSAPAVDTTGAGDAYAAGFLYGLLNKKGLAECGRLGDLVARFCITEMGARPGLPTLAELSQRYQELYGQEL